MNNENMSNNPTLTCPSCNMAVPENSKFCPNCGYNFFQNQNTNQLPNPPVTSINEQPTSLNNNVNQNINQLPNPLGTKVNEEPTSPNIINQSTNQSPNTQNISESPIPQETPKGKRNFIPLIIVGIVVLVAIVCGIYFLTNNKAENPKDVALNYVKSLIKKDYNTALNYINLPQNHFVKLDDYSEYIQKQEYFEKLTSSNIKEIKEKLKTESKATYIITLNDSNKTPFTLDISLLFNDEKKWRIDEKSFYTSNWGIYIPKGTKLYIDDTLVIESLINKTDTGSNNLFDYYIIPAISNSKRIFKADATFEMAEAEITPVISNANQEFDIELKNEEITKKAYEFIKDTWNALYQEYEKGTDVSDIQKYFDSNIDLNQINTYYKDGFDSLTKGTSGYKYYNFILNYIVNDSEKINYVSANNIITLNFGYNLTWKWEFTEDLYEMNRYSKIRLKYENNEFKIYEVSDSKLFSYISQYTKQF